MKRTLISIPVFILLIFGTIQIYAAETDIVETPEETEDSQPKKPSLNFKPMDNYQISRIAYWSGWGAPGIISFVNTFVQLSNAMEVSKQLAEVVTDLKKVNFTFETMNTFIDYYPTIIFGIHFLTSGFSCIPVAGGLVYGFLLYGAGIAFSAIRIFVRLFDPEHVAGAPQSLLDKMQAVENDIFNPTSYFVIGTFSIIMGIGQLITYLIYRKEARNRKYPNLNKIFTIENNAFVIRLNV